MPALPRRLSLGLIAATLLAPAAGAQAPGSRLFKVVGPRDIAILRHDALRIGPCTAALPVAPPAE
ncbi:MAG: hypothetical protein IRY87_36675 [Acetobacteraceae bacterium]|nr:hypothetical protein [Acetobacteraceae bacterium]